MPPKSRLSLNRQPDIRGIRKGDYYYKSLAPSPDELDIWSNDYFIQIAGMMKYQEDKIRP